MNAPARLGLFAAAAVAALGAGAALGAAVGPDVADEPTPAPVAPAHDESGPVTTTAPPAEGHGPGGHG